MRSARRNAVLWLTCGTLALAGLAVAQDAKKDAKGDEKSAKGPGVKCPVSGQPANLFVSLATDDGPVYFCCPNCVDKYKAKPAEFADKLKEQRAALAKLPKVQTTCPIEGAAVDPDVSIEKDGQKIAFCCAGCKGKYEADAAKYKGKLASCFTYQTNCPVMGKAISPDVSIELSDGTHVYFCCKKCIAPFSSEPAKYADSLLEQGYKLDPAKIKKAGEKKPDEKKDDKPK